MQKNWWRNKVVYQIYPQSFYDSNGDGIGDIQGIIKKLDYLQDLGIDIIWICPIFNSPMVDNGYDISDYYSIHANYGDFTDLKELIQKANERNIKILLDLVINHCSDKHKWFQKAIQNPEGKYGDYFIFKKGKNGEPPSNWRSIFGGSVWEKVANSDYYYYHTFSKEQPDFNWENKELRTELYKMINFWLELGIGGFRIDAITFIKKELSFQSLPADREDGLVGLRTVGINYPGIEVFLKEMRRETFDKYNAFSVAEMSGVNPDHICEYIGDNGFYDTIFDFSYMNLDLDGTTHWYKHRAFSAKEVNQALFASHQKAQDINAFLSVVLENHDQPRALNKWFPKKEITFEMKAMLAILNLTLRGIPFLYQGQEIGMTNHQWECIEEIKEVKSLSQYETALSSGLSKEDAFHAIAYRSRDNARTPMQWNDGVNGGFTSAKPWTRVNPNYTAINVEKQQSDNKGLFSFYKRLIHIRKDVKFGNVLLEGDISQIFEEYDTIIGYERSTSSQTLHILLNYSDSIIEIPYPHNIWSCVVDNYNRYQFVDGILTLRPYEGVVLEIGKE